MTTEFNRGQELLGSPEQQDRSITTEHIQKGKEIRANARLNIFERLARFGLVAGGTISGFLLGSPFTPVGAITGSVVGNRLGRKLADNVIGR